MLPTTLITPDQGEPDLKTNATNCNESKINRPELLMNGRIPGPYRATIHGQPKRARMTHKVHHAHCNTERLGHYMSRSVLRSEQREEHCAAVGSNKFVGLKQ